MTGATAFAKYSRVYLCGVELVSGVELPFGLVLSGVEFDDGLVVLLPLVDEFMSELLELELGLELVPVELEGEVEFMSELELEGEVEFMSELELPVEGDVVEDGDVEVLDPV